MTDTNVPEQRVEVTQADREAAADLAALNIAPIDGNDENAIRRGFWDKGGDLSFIVQAFARHRTASQSIQPSATEAVLREAALPFVQHWQKWMDETDATPDGSYNHANTDEMSVFARVTFGDLRRLCAILSTHPGEQARSVPEGERATFKSTLAETVRSCFAAPSPEQTPEPSPLEAENRLLREALDMAEVTLRLDGQRLRSAGLTSLQSDDTLQTVNAALGREP